MAVAKNREEYCKCWKNGISGILYGPVRDAYLNEDLCTRMRETVTEMCKHIDEVGELLVKDGTFSK